MKANKRDGGRLFQMDLLLCRRATYRERTTREYGPATNRLVNPFFRNKT